LLTRAFCHFAAEKLAKWNAILAGATWNSWFVVGSKGGRMAACGEVNDSP
jgi:hypothetical protein